MMAKRAIVAVIVGLMFAMPIGMVVGQIDQGYGAGEACVSYMPYYWYEPGDFDYGHGILSGNYMNFEFNETTGTITDYTVKVTRYETIYPVIMYEAQYDITGAYMDYRPLAQENLTIFDSMEIGHFTPAGSPGTFADMFLFQGDDVFFQCYDYEGGYSSYLSDDENVTFTFEVVAGFEVSRFYDWYVEEWEESWEEEYRLDLENETIMPGVAEPYWEPYYNWDEVWIEGFNTTSSIYIQNGTATIENNIITIELGPEGRVDISTWAEMPYFDYYLGGYDAEWDDNYGFVLDTDVEGIEPPSGYDRNIIDTAVEDGTLAGAGYMFAENGNVQWSDTNSYSDPTFQMAFVDVRENLVEIEVDSLIPEGRIVSLNLNEGALDAATINELLVKLDDSPVDAYDTLEELTRLVGGAEPGYYAMFSETGMTIFVYVPHFSTHTITVETVHSAITNILVPALLAMVFVAAIVLVVMFRGKKGKDEY